MTPENLMDRVFFACTKKYALTNQFNWRILLPKIAYRVFIFLKFNFMMFLCFNYTHTTYQNESKVQ